MQYLWVSFKATKVWSLYHRYSKDNGDKTWCGKPIIGPRLDTTTRPTDEYRCKRCTTLSKKKETKYPYTSYGHTVTVLMKYLDHEEMKLVLGDEENRGKLVIAATVDYENENILFSLGDWKVFRVPFEAFEPSGDGTIPDFGKLKVIDCGHTIQLGDYEAAVDALLEEYGDSYESENPDYCRWAND